MDFDIIMAGAGPGGCVAARDLSRAGFNVGLFDTHTRSTLGKPIIIEADKATFARVGVKPPTGDEIPYHPKLTRVFSYKYKEAFNLAWESPVVAMYLDRYVRGLLSEAEAAGVKFFENHRAESPIISEGKVCGVSFRAGDKTFDAKARLVIDDTGFSASLLRKLDPELGMEFNENPKDIVLAENHLYSIDTDKARQAIKNGLAGDEEAWGRFSFTTPYSTEFSFLSLNKRKAYILVGQKADFEGMQVSEVIAKFKERQGYMTERLYGGAGLIRISHSLDRFVTDGFMVIGEAACQVVPAYGSGVSSSLYSGHLAAKTAARALKDGEATTEALWPYAWEYQANRGGLLAVFDVGRLTIDALSLDQVAGMLEGQVTTPQDFHNALIPKGVSYSPVAMYKRACGLMKNRSLVGPIFKMAKAAVAVQRHYAKYPKSYSPKVFAEWAATNKRLFAQFTETEAAKQAP